MDKVAPDAVAYHPAPHSVQLSTDAAARSDAYVPAAQVVHVAEELAPHAVEYVPAPQLTHTVAVVLVTYFPAGQLVTAETLGISKSTTVATMKKCIVRDSTVAAFYTSAPPQKRQG